MKKILGAVTLVAVLLLTGAAVAQQFGANPQFAGGTPQGGAQQGVGQQPAMAQPGGVQQPQYGAQQPSTGAGALNIPPAPAKPVPNSAYGNNDRAAIIGQQLSDASQGNANVYVSENPNRTVSLDVKLLQDADPYSLAGTMANLTYMVDSVYSITDMKGSDILLTVYDTAGNVITSAKFSDAKNAFESYTVPEGAAAKPTPVTQPGYGQPSTGRPGFGQPSTGMPGAGQPSGTRPVSGFR